MTRTVYLIRHAMPDIPLGERWCVGGLTDLPLSEIGRLQAALLPFVPELQGVTAVFCSSQRSAIETARPLCAEPRVIEGLQEQVMGVWDGLSFVEIQEKYPALYGRIGFIDAVSHKFCASCNRVHLTSAGLLKPCLCFDATLDVRALLRSGCDDAEVTKALQSAVYQKPRAHCFDEQAQITERHLMSQIGG